MDLSNGAHEILQSENSLEQYEERIPRVPPSSQADKRVSAPRTFADNECCLYLFVVKALLVTRTFEAYMVPLMSEYLTVTRSFVATASGSTCPALPAWCLDLCRRTWCCCLRRSSSPCRRPPLWSGSCEISTSPCQWRSLSCPGLAPEAQPPGPRCTTQRPMVRQIGSLSSVLRR